MDVVWSGLLLASHSINMKILHVRWLGLIISIGCIAGIFMLSGKGCYFRKDDPMLSWITESKEGRDSVRGVLNNASSRNLGMDDDSPFVTIQFGPVLDEFSRKIGVKIDVIQAVGSANEIHAVKFVIGRHVFASISNEMELKGVDFLETGKADIVHEDHGFFILKRRFRD